MKNMMNQATQCCQLCSPILHMYSFSFLFLQYNGVDGDELNADEAEHEENRELVLQDQEEPVLDIGFVWESLHKHVEALKHLSRCIASVVPHDGFICCVLYGQEAFFAVSFKLNIKGFFHHFSDILQSFTFGKNIN